MWGRIDKEEDGADEIVHNIDEDDRAGTWQVRRVLSDPSYRNAPRQPSWTGLAGSCCGDRTHY